MKTYWIAQKKGEVPRMARYASTISALEKKGFKLSQVGPENIPSYHIWISKKRK